MPDKYQRITYYISGAGLTVYEIEQYNAEVDAYFIVGDCSTSLDYMLYKAYNHNMEILRSSK